jgi:septal ring factor EnvC (AmiA/AmiB activator)
MTTDERLHEKRDARIAAGREAYEGLRKHEHFRSWLAIADALAAIREEAMELAHTNRPQGPPYRAAHKRIVETREQWVTTINSATQTHCYWLVDNLPAIMTWREALTFEQRDLWNHPSTIKRQFERMTKAKEEKDPNGPKHLTPLEQANLKIVELQEENDRLKKQLARGDDGSLFDLKKDTGRMIARVIRATVGRDKRREISKLLAPDEAQAG